MSAADAPDAPAGHSELIVSNQPLGAGMDFTDPHSPMAPYYLKSADVVGVAILALVIAFYGWFFPLWHTDIWGHVQFGEWILDHRAFPEREPFTPYSSPGVKPLQTQWLTQVVYASLFRLGQSLTGSAETALAYGAEMLRCFHWLVLSARFIFLWLAFRRVSGSSIWANFGLVVLFAEMIWPSAVQRPQAIAMLCFSIQMYMLSRRPLSRASQFGLPILFAFWANLHGSFLLGLAFFFLNLLERAASQRGESGHPSWRAVFRTTEIRQLSMAFAMSFAAAAILNPHGPLLLVHVLTFASQPNISQLNEWRPLAFHLGAGGHWLFLASWSAVLAFWAGSGFKMTWRLLSIAPFGLWPLLQERAMIWWLMLIPWMLASLGPLIAQRIGLRLPVGIPSLRKTILAAGVALVAILWSPPIQWLIKGRSIQPFSAATPWRLSWNCGLRRNREAGGCRHSQTPFAPIRMDASRESFLPVKPWETIWCGSRRSAYRSWSIRTLSIFPLSTGDNVWRPKRRTATGAALCSPIT